MQSAAPDLRIVCLHGKLAADEIDDRMMSFVEGEADVLLATNIVESGLDIPGRIPLSSAGPKSSVWRNSISSGVGWDEAARVPLRIC